MFLSDPKGSIVLSFLCFPSIAAFGSLLSFSGVMIHASQLHHNLCFGANRKHLTSDCNPCICWVPVYHDLGLIASFLLSFYGGYGLVAMSPLTFLKDPNIFLNAASRFKVESGFFPNFGSASFSPFPPSCHWHLNFPVISFYFLSIRLELMVRKFDRSRVDPDFNLSSIGLWCVCAEPVRRSTLEKFFKCFGPLGFRADAFLSGL